MNELKEKLQVEIYQDKLKELKEDLEKELKEINESVASAKEKRKKLQKVRKAFLTKRSGFIIKKDEKVDDLKEYVVFLMKNNGHTDILEGVQAGEFYLKSSSGKEEKSIMLTANKLTTINYNNQYFKGWIVHEDNMAPYPQDPIHNGEVFRKITQKLAMNYRDVSDAKYLEASTKRIVVIILVSLVVLYVLFIMAKNGNWFDSGTVNTATEVVKETITNSTVGVRAN